MKKMLLAGLIAALPLFAQAADNSYQVGTERAHRQAPAYGSQDGRGNYWDGRTWRDKDYWERNNGPRGEKHYTGRSQDAKRPRDAKRHQDDDRRREARRQQDGNQPQGVPHQNKKGFCPPGQAKKGNC